MYTMKVDNVRIQDRQYFKDKIESIHPFFHINCRKEEALVTFKEPYVFDANDIQEKGKAITELKMFLNDFRHYQFAN